jgi:hypothetical protein
MKPINMLKTAMQKGRRISFWPASAEIPARHKARAATAMAANSRPCVNRLNLLARYLNIIFLIQPPYNLPSAVKLKVFSAVGGYFSHPVLSHFV